MQKEYDVIIVGAGMAGLMSAIYLEKKGFEVAVIEAGSKPGGRVSSEHLDGFILEKGFQVIISSYEKAREVFDWEKLKMRSFKPGALITDEKGDFVVADPLRDQGKALSTLFSRVGTLNDKWKILSLVKDVKRKDFDKLFEGKQESTLEFLRAYGFSGEIIDRFFRPFFGGIFLERELSTQAAMFRFVFKNFANGEACLPANGMSALAEQLVERLEQTEIYFNTEVASVSSAPELTLQNGEKIKARKIILACEPGKILPQIDAKLSWNSTTTMYFSGDRILKTMEKRIGLDARENSPINNYARHDEVNPNSAPENRSLWSVTLRNPDTPEIEVRKTLRTLIGAQAGSLEHLKTYKIARALPILSKPSYSIQAEATKLMENIHLAGDYLTNGSIEGALIAGERAAEAVADSIEVRAGKVFGPKQD